MTELTLGTSAQVNRLNSLWTAERVDRLRELHAIKPMRSLGLIATILSQEYRVRFTRNAVIGKVNRIGLEPRGKRPIITREAGGAAPRKTYTRRLNVFGGTVKVVDSPTLVDRAALRAAEVEPLHVGLLDLSADQCRYPYGDGPFTFCGCPAIPGLTYCEPHQRLTHTNAVMTRDERAILKDRYKQQLKEAWNIQREGVACL